MNSINLLDELLSGLQLQKEYIGLELAEKLTHLLAVTSLALALLITGTTLLYFWGGPLASLAFLVISLLITSSIAFYRKQAIAHIKKEKKPGGGVGRGGFHFLTNSRLTVDPI